ncbi:MAG TPA: KH domain-containing protein [bacterium]|nr:KH domain-containing protein [bacterium]
METVKKTASTISEAVREFLNENNTELSSVYVNLLSEKVFTDKKEFTVELSVRVNNGQRPPPPPEVDMEYAKDILSGLLTHMKFTGFQIETPPENGIKTLKINVPGKDGLLIGKNGRNILSMQYILSSALEKKFRRHTPVLIDIDSYRSKRAAYLKNTAAAMCQKAKEEQCEIITELLPSYERKLIHEELSGDDSIKTFSAGKGPYKKVVITALL